VGFQHLDWNLHVDFTFRIHMQNSAILGHTEFKHTEFKHTSCRLKNGCVMSALCHCNMFCLNITFVLFVLFLFACFFVISKTKHFKTNVCVCVCVCVCIFISCFN
jgi:hypothetical protein